MAAFFLPMKAFSINASTTRDARFKSSAYKDWHAEIKQRILDLDNLKEFTDIAADHKKSGGEFEVWIEISYPNHVYYNASKQISAKTFDVTNTEKLLVDVVFGDILEVNDRYITKLTSSKRPGASYGIYFKLELHT